MTRKIFRKSIVFIALLATGAARADSGEVCDRKCLRIFVDDYIAAMLKHDPAGLPVSSSIKVAQDAQEIKPGEGVWKTAVKFYSLPSQTQYLMDTETGQVGYMGILDDGAAGPAFFALRLKIADKKITEVESMVTHRSDATPFWPQGYLWREAPYIREAPLKVRSSRQQLLKTADTYWKIAATTHKGEDVPYSVDCWHFQNGMNTDWERPLNSWEEFDPKLKVQRNVMASPAQEYDGRIWTCAREATLTTLKWTGIHSTHQLVDVERGLVMSWNMIDIDPDKLPKAPRKPDGSRYPSPEGFYGPPSSPGPDGMPLPEGAGMGSTTLDTTKPYATYQTYLFRIVGGKITREQVFQRFLPANTPSPF